MQVHNFMYSFEIAEEDIKNGIKASDFLVTDNNSTHRLIGLKYEYDNKNDYPPEITIICSRHEMALAKQIAFSCGKKIYTNSSTSALLYSKYQIGQKILPDDFSPIAVLYAEYGRLKGLYK